MGIAGGAGFIGDDDDVEDDENGANKNDNDDWMFQTFEKKTKIKRNNSKKRTQSKG